MNDSKTYRTVAAEWHGGQTSALYALASSDTIMPGIYGEIADCIAFAKTEGFPEDIADLENLLDHVESREDGEDHEGFTKWK